MKKAVIDIGSNSVKFLVCEKLSDNNVKTILDTNEIARLGEGLQKEGRITPSAMSRNVDAVKSFYERAAALGCDEIKAVGTMALRQAENRGEFIEKVRAACGLKVEVIPGEEEARLSYLGVLSALPLKDEEVTAFDTGGGSTEFIFGKGERLENRISINLGANRIRETYLLSDPPKKEEIENAGEAVKRELQAAGIKKHGSLLVGIGGTVTTMASVKAKMEVYDADKIQGSILTKEDIEEEMNLCASMTLEERRHITGLNPKRAEVVTAGALIVDTIIKELGVSSLLVSDRGLRHGLMYLLFAKNIHKKDTV